jgi:TRAP-type uncharacterized transport system fused permease subunit
MGVPPLAAHLFIFYYGILADLTPPVCVAAFAAAGIAGADPFKTGNTAFKLGTAKATVPFVFVYAPSMLLVLPGFTWFDFAVSTVACALGIAGLGIAMTGFLVAPMGMLSRWWLTFASLLTIAPSVTSTAVGLAMAAPVIGLNLLRARGTAVPAQPR